MHTSASGLKEVFAWVPENMAVQSLGGGLAVSSRAMPKYRITASSVKTLSLKS